MQMYNKLLFSLTFLSCIIAIQCNINSTDSSITIEFSKNVITSYQDSTNIANFKIKPLGVKKMTNGEYLVFYSHPLKNEATNYHCYLAKSSKSGTKWDTICVGSGHSGELKELSNGFALIFCHHDDLIFQKVSSNGNLENSSVKLNGKGFYDVQMLIEGDTIYVLAHGRDSTLFYISTNQGITWNAPEALDESGHRIMPSAFFTFGDTIHILKYVKLSTIRLIHYWKLKTKEDWESREFTISDIDEDKKISAFDAQKNGETVRIVMYAEGKEIGGAACYYIASWDSNDNLTGTPQKVTNDFISDHASSIHMSFNIDNGNELLAFGDDLQPRMYLKSQNNSWQMINDTTLNDSYYTDCYIVTNIEKNTSIIDLVYSANPLWWQKLYFNKLSF